MSAWPDDSTAFDPVAALRGVNFDPATVDGNGAPDGHNTSGNGLPDAHEMALVAAVVNDPTIDFSARGGVSHREARAVFDALLTRTRLDTASLAARWPTTAEMVTGYLMIGTDDGIASISHMTTMFGAPLTGDMNVAKRMAYYFAPDGDADGDGVSNREEHAAAGASAEQYVAAALDPTVRNRGNERMSTNATSKRTVGIVLYEGFEVLDVFGPMEMWSYVPDFRLVTIAATAGPVKSTQGAVLMAEYGFADAPKLDILMVPGGFGTIAELDNTALITYLRNAHATSELTTSVCTGSALLARAGALDGLRATSNKRFFSLAAKQSDRVKWVVEARWVEDGKVFTSSGVSAGTDMALAVVARLHGVEAARQLASSVEYIWHEQPDDDPFAGFSDWPGQ
ncbi:MAG: DJ-1/PfpI family protein [Pseudomonadales bacterium]|nr:DJ-1/PfpI family protein [Pseudomonadales bacterium]